MRRLVVVGVLAASCGHTTELPTLLVPLGDAVGPAASPAIEVPREDLDRDPGARVVLPAVRVRR